MMRRLVLSTVLLVAVSGACDSGDTSPGAAAGAPGAGGSVASNGGSVALGGASGVGGALGGTTTVTSGGAALGGSVSTGGSATGGSATGGAPQNVFGGAGAAAGGISSSGGVGGTTGGNAAGGNAAGANPTGGAATGGTSSSGGVGSATGGANAAGVGGGTILPPLRITSDTASIEYTPALIAAQDFYPGTATVASGGIPSLLMNSNVDLGTNAETQTLRQSVMYPNIRIIFTVTETFYRIIASKKAGIAQLSDLKGKRVGTVLNTSAAYYVNKTVRLAGLLETDVTVVSGGLCMRAPCGANTLPGMLASGSVAAVTLWEPTARLAAHAIGEDAIEFQDRKVYREIVNLHTTAEKLADPEKRRAIVGFVRALMKAQELYRTHPEQVWPRIASAINIEQAILEEVWEDEQFLGTLVPDILDVLVEEDVWVAKQQNRTARTREELSKLVDDSIMKEAMLAP